MGVVGLGVTVILSLERRTTVLKVENGKQGREKTFKSLRKDWSCSKGEISHYLNVPKYVFSAVFKAYFSVLFYVYMCNSSGMYVCHMYSGA